MSGPTRITGGIPTDPPDLGEPDHDERIVYLSEWARRTNDATRAFMGVRVRPAWPSDDPTLPFAERVQLALAEARELLAEADEILDEVSVVPDDRDQGDGRDPTEFRAACRAADAEFLVKQKDPARLRSWLAELSAPEREAILRHLEQRKKRNGGNG